MYRAERCLCGQRACSDWHVTPSAAMHGVVFTHTQAEVVSEALNALSGERDDADPEITWIDIPGGRCTIRNAVGERWSIDTASGAQALVEGFLTDIGQGRIGSVMRLPVSVRVEMFSAPDGVEQRVDELRTHAVEIGRDRSIGHFSVHTLPATIAAVDPHADWVATALRAPERSIRSILEQSARTTRSASRVLARAIWNDPRARAAAATPEDATERTVVVTVEGGLVDGVAFPGRLAGTEIEVHVRNHDIEGAEDSEIETDEQGRGGYVGTVWRNPRGTV